MRVKSNKKIHKMKRDPYKTLLKVTGILAIVVVVGIGIFWLCSVLVMNDFRAQRDEMDLRNLQAEQEYEALVAAAMTVGETPAQAAAFVEPRDPQSWENTLDGSQWRIDDEGTNNLENVSGITVDRYDMIVGGMMLVNPWHPLPADFDDGAVVSIGARSGNEIPTANNSVQVFPVAYEALAAMIAAAKEAGHQDYIVREAYRSMATQTEIYEKRKNELSSKYSGDVLDIETKKRVNYPGTSEFQTGLSFLMGLYNKDDASITGTNFQESAQGKWFLENSWKYGVIFRFPTKDFPSTEWEDKSYKTSVSVELNLYRYVGEPHAAAMRILGYCMEEYVEFLMEHPHIYIYKDNELQYEIFRFESEDVATYDVPIKNNEVKHWASIDNLGGVVMGYSFFP